MDVINETGKYKSKQSNCFLVLRSRCGRLPGTPHPVFSGSLSFSFFSVHKISHLVDPKAVSIIWPLPISCHCVEGCLVLRFVLGVGRWIPSFFESDKSHNWGPSMSVRKLKRI
jgi:hypothetical protein